MITETTSGSIEPNKFVLVRALFPHTEPDSVKKVTDRLGNPGTFPVVSLRWFRRKNKLKTTTHAEYKIPVAKSFAEKYHLEVLS